MEPLDVALAGSLDIKDEEFRGLVAVEVVEAGFKGGEFVGTGLEEEDSLGCGFDVAFPVEDGLDRGDERSAGSELLFDEGTAGLCGLIGRGAGGDDEANGRAGFGSGVGHIGVL